MRITWGPAEWKNALITALAAALCYGLTLILRLTAGYWAAITSIVVMQSEVGATLVASRDRLIGTAIGATIGWLAVLLWPEPIRATGIVVFGAAVFLSLAICNVLNLKSAARLSGITVAIVVLIHGAEPAGHAALSRFFEVSLGAVVALIVTAVFYPKTLLDGSTIAKK